MPSPAEVHDSLAALAEPVHPSVGYEVRVLRRARRLRARRRLAGAAAAVGLALAMLALPVGPAPQLTAPPPDGPFLGWPAAGEVNAGLVREAIDVWGPHTAVRPLVAAHEQLLRSVVVLQGYDRRNSPRLAFFTGDATAAGALRLRADRPAPDPVTTRVVSLVSPRLTGPAGQAGEAFWDTYAIALAMPGVESLRVSTTTVDNEMTGDPGAATGRFVVSAGPNATAETTTVIGLVKPAKLFARWRTAFTASGDGGADGDAQGVRAKVLRHDGQQVVVTFPVNAAVQPGLLAVVAQGLVGRVTAVDHARGEATIDLVTSVAFTSPAYASISEVPGSVRGDGGRLFLQHIPPGDKMEVYEGNRIVVADPAQQDDHLGAITVGRAAATKPSGSDSVELTPTADLTHLREVSIMTPLTKRSR